MTINVKQEQVSSSDTWRLNSVIIVKVPRIYSIQNIDKTHKIYLYTIHPSLHSFNQPLIDHFK